MAETIQCKQHVWGKIGSYDICKVCCHLKSNWEDKPCPGPDFLRPLERPMARNLSKQEKDHG